jgi:hypothetical protein
MPGLKNCDTSIRLVRVAELWSYIYNINKWSTITDDLDLDFGVLLTVRIPIPRFSTDPDHTGGRNDQTDPQAAGVIGKPKLTLIVRLLFMPNLPLTV